VTGSALLARLSGPRGGGEDLLRERVVRWLGVLLALVSGWLVVRVDRNVERGALEIGTMVAVVFAGGVLALRPRTHGLAVFVGVTAWLIALGSAFEVVRDIATDLGHRSIVRPLELGATSLAMLGGSILLVATLTGALDPGRPIRARWSWAAAVALSLPLLGEGYATWEGDRGATRWYGASEWHARSVWLFSLGCAACLALFVAIERRPAHRPILACACLVAVVFAGPGWALVESDHRIPPEHLLGACWSIVMAISLVPFIVAHSDPIPGEGS